MFNCNACSKEILFQGLCNSCRKYTLRSFSQTSSFKEKICNKCNYYMEENERLNLIIMKNAATIDLSMNDQLKNDNNLAKENERLKKEHEEEIQKQKTKLFFKIEENEKQNKDYHKLKRKLIDIVDEFEEVVEEKQNIRMKYSPCKSWCGEWGEYCCRG